MGLITQKLFLLEKTFFLKITRFRITCARLRRAHHFVADKAVEADRQNEKI